MYSIYDSAKDELLSFNGFHEIKNEITFNYGVNSDMPYSVFCRIASLKKEEITSLDNIFRKILSSNEVVMMHGSGNELTTMYLNRRNHIIENDKAFVSSLAKPERLLLISTYIKAFDYEAVESIGFRLSYDVLNPEKEDIANFKKRINRLSNIDAILNDLSC